MQIGDGVHTEGFEHLIGYKWDAVQIARGMLDWWNNSENGCVTTNGEVMWRPEDIPETIGALNQRIAGEDKHGPVKAWVRAAIKKDVEGLTWDNWNSNDSLYHHHGKDWINVHRMNKAQMAAKLIELGVSSVSLERQKKGTHSMEMFHFDSSTFARRGSPFAPTLSELKVELQVTPNDG